MGDKTYDGQISVIKYFCPSQSPVGILQVFWVVFDSSLRVGNANLQCNEFNWGHPKFFCQSQGEFRTKEAGLRLLSDQSQ